MGLEIVLELGLYAGLSDHPTQVHGTSNVCTKTAAVDDDVKIRANRRCMHAL